jgi:hypothetical protein
MDFNDAHPFAPSYSRILSFLLYMVYVSHREDNAKIGLFVETVVRDMNKALEEVLPLNFAGYRIWLLFPCTCYSAEVTMRRAVLQTQVMLGYCTDPEVFCWKKKYVFIPTADGREHVIKNDAPLPDFRESKRDEQDPGAAEMRRNAQVESAQQKFLDKVIPAIRYPIQGGVVNAAERADGWTCAGSLVGLVRNILAPISAAASLPFRDGEYTEACAALAHPWAESRLFADYPQGSFLHRMSPSLLFSFDIGLLVARLMYKDPLSMPCEEQLSIYNYFPDGLEGPLTLPYPKMVRRIDAEFCAPHIVFAQNFFWWTNRFMREISLYTKQFEIEDQAAADEQIKSRGFQKSALPRVTNSGWAVDISPNLLLAKFAAKNGLDMHVDEEHPMVRAKRVMTDYTNAIGSDEKKTQSAGVSQRQQSFVTIKGALTLFMEEEQRNYLQITTVINRLRLGGKPPAWIRMEMSRLNRLRLESSIPKLLRACANELLVSDLNRTAYNMCMTEEDLSKMVMPSESPAVDMCQDANALIYMNALISATETNPVGILGLVFVQTAEVASVKPVHHSHTMRVGPPGSGKSHEMDIAVDLSPEGAWQRSMYESLKSMYVTQWQGKRGNAADEANQMMTDHTARSQEKYAETIQHVKTLLTTGMLTLARTMQTENGVFYREQTQVENPRLNIMNANQIMLDYKNGTIASLALLNRISVEFHMPDMRARGRSALQAILQEHSQEFLAAADAIKLEVQKFMATVVMSVVFSTSGLLQFNEAMVKVMQTKAVGLLAGVYPRLEQEIRKIERNNTYGSYSHFACEMYRLLRSYGSHVLADNLRDGLTFGVHDLPYLIHPCTRTTQGLAAVFRTVTEFYPFVTYLMLRVAASHFCYFSRAKFANVFKKAATTYGIPSLDETFRRVWMERGHGALPLSYPYFIQSLLEIEAQLDARADALMHSANRKCPVFLATGPHTALSYDPNWLDCCVGMNLFIERLVPVFQQLFFTDQATIKSALSMVSHIAIRVPVFSRVDSALTDVTEDSLAFRSVAAVNSVTSKVAEYAEVAPWRCEKSFHRAHGPTSPLFDTVQINTAALMSPPHLCAALALCFENNHTKPLNTVLISPMPRYPSLLIPWQVRPRNAVEPGNTRPRDCADNTNYAQPAKEVVGIAGLMRAASLSNDTALHAAVIAANTNQITDAQSTEDDERRIFAAYWNERHMDIPLDEMLDIAVDMDQETHERLAQAMRKKESPDEKDYQALVTHLMKKDPAYPGNAERLCEERENKKNLRERRMDDVYPSTRRAALDCYTAIAPILRKEPPPLAKKKTAENYSEPLANLNKTIDELKAVAAISKVENEKAKPVMKELVVQKTRLERSLMLVSHAPLQGDLDADVNDRQFLDEAKKGVRALCLMLCSNDHLFDNITKYLSKTQEWGHLFNMVFAKYNPSCKRLNPVPLPRLSAADEQFIVTNAKRIPGFSTTRPLTTATLYWLEGMLHIRRIFEEVAYIYAADKTGSLIDALHQVADTPMLLNAMRTCELAIKAGNAVVISKYVYAMRVARRVRSLWMEKCKKEVTTESENQQTLYTHSGYYTPDAVVYQRRPQLPAVTPGLQGLYHQFLPAQVPPALDV